MKDQSGSHVFTASEEVVKVSKKKIETGRVVLRKKVETEIEEVQIPRSETRIEIERHIVNKLVDSAPLARQEGDTHIVPVIEEIWVLEKKLLLKEEIHVRQKSKLDVETQQVELRKERLEVESRQNPDLKNSKKGV